MDRDLAIKARDRAIEAVRQLNSILALTKDWDDVSLAELHRGIGISIGLIDTELLCKIYDKYPDLDDLRINE